MLIGILGDTHYTNRGPGRRKDNYFQTQIEKTKEAFSIFFSRECGKFIQSGDLFDSTTVANKVKAEIISLILSTPRDGFYCIAGQHDIVGHSLSTLHNSPLAVLAAAEAVTLLGNQPTILETRFPKEDPEWNMYGCSFGQPVPEPISNENNILVIHAMIGDRELYPGQELTSPRSFLKKYPKYQLIVCGDYHYTFKDSYQGRTIVNAGCLVRKTISKFDLEHKPSVAIFDTLSKELEIIPLKSAKPVEEVFDLSRSVDRDAFDVDEFIKALRKENFQSGDLNSSVQWKQILSKVVSEKKCSKEVIELIASCIEEVVG